MSNEVRDVTTLTFSGPRFEDAGLELDVLRELVVYRKLLVETAKELWRSENRDRQRLPNGFEESIHLKFYKIEPGSVTVPIKRVVTYDPSSAVPKRERADEIDEAAQLIDETIVAVAENHPVPEKTPKSILRLLAGFGESLREGEAIKTRALRSAKGAEFTRATRARLERLLEAVYEDSVDIVGEIRAADIDQRSFVMRDPSGRKIPARFQPEQEIKITGALREHSSWRVHLVGKGEFSMRDGSLRRVLRVDLLEREPDEGEREYDDSVQPLWQSVIELGASLPPEEWERVPRDLASNLDRYLYGGSGEDQ